MNTEKAADLLEQIAQIDREIQAMRDAIEFGDTFAVVGGSKFARPARVEVTKDMAEPFLQIGLKSLQRKRSQVAAQVRAL